MAEGRVDVACVGETMLLLVPDPPASPADAECFRRDIGGAESNVAIGLRRLGRVTSWHSVLGDDAFGDYVYARIADEGVSCVVRRDAERPTGLYVKELRGETTTVRYYRSGSAAARLVADDVHRVIERAPALVHTSGITPSLSPENREMIELLWATRPERTTLSFDVNFRPALHGSDVAPVLLDLADRADLVFCGEDEAAALWGTTSPEQVREMLPGPSTLVVKQGATGATAFGADGRHFHPAPSIDVVEPVGAGDAFASGFIHEHLRGAGGAAALAEGTRLAGAALSVHGDLPAPAVYQRDGQGD